MKTTRKGFTLIELLIVIAIIGVLAVAFVPSILGAPSKGRDAARIADLQKLQKVLISENLEGEAYPASTQVIPGATFKTGVLWSAQLAPSLGGVIPSDPQPTHAWAPADIFTNATAGKYHYLKAPTADYSFGLYAKMETKEAGNASCTALKGSPIAISTDPAVPANDADSCYAILTE